MAQATNYYPIYTFRDQEWKADLLPLWDDEHEAISVSINEIIHNQSLIQRDDGKLANGSVHPLSLDGATLQLLNMVPQWQYQGLWENGTLYQLGDMVVYKNSTFVAVKCHTAGVCDIEEEGEEPEDCPDCIYADPENPTEEEIEACFMAEYEQRERWVPLCCGFGSGGGATQCLEDTTGTETAYVVTSSSQDPITEYLDGMRCMLRWHVNSGVGASLEIDGLGPKNICFDRSPTDVDDMIADSIDQVVYNAVTDCFDIIGRDRVVTPTYAEPWNTGDIRHTMRAEPATGWTFLDGLTIGTTGSGADFEGPEYRDLFDLLKGRFPNDGNEVFDNGDLVTKPDASVRSLLGWGNMRTPEANPTLPEDELAQVLGSRNHTLTTDEMPVHQHTINAGGLHAHNVEVSSMQNTSGTNRQADKYPDNSEFMSTRLGGNHSHTMQNAGGGASHNNLGPSLVAAIEIRL